MNSSTWRLARSVRHRAPRMSRSKLSEWAPLRSSAPSSAKRYEARAAPVDRCTHAAARGATAPDNPEMLQAARFARSAQWSAASTRRSAAPVSPSLTWDRAASRACKSSARSRTTSSCGESWDSRSSRQASTRRPAARLPAPAEGLLVDKPSTG